MKNKLFEIILGITAIFIAIVSAYFSVYGIAGLFSGAMLSVIIMASGIEVGKVCAVTFLYRYWNKTKSFLKYYLIIASIILTIITSAGIFGYLSSAYQKSSIEYKIKQEKIVMVEGQKSYIHDKMNQSKDRIKILNDMRAVQESRLSEALTNVFISRNPTQLKQIQAQTIELISSSDKSISDENNKLQQYSDNLQKIDMEVGELKLGLASKKDIIAFQYVANQMGTTLDVVAKWFIIVLICVFDPLALALLLAYNTAMYKNINDTPLQSRPSTYMEEKKSEVSDQQLPKPSEPISTTVNVPENISTPQIPQLSSEEMSSLKQMFKL